jgi:hypothetical protein
MELTGYILTTTGTLTVKNRRRVRYNSVANTTLADLFRPNPGPFSPYAKLLLIIPKFS